METVAPDPDSAAWLWDLLDQGAEWLYAAKAAGKAPTSVPG